MTEFFINHVSNIFYETANKKSDEVRLTFSDKVRFSLLKPLPKPEVILPLPKMINQKYYFEGFVFENSENSLQIIWSLFIASIYHLAAHIAISDYSIYEKWKENKSHDVCWRVIDFIEDAVVEKYLSSTNNQVWNGMKQINQNIKYIYNNQSIENNKQLFSEFYIKYNIGKIEKIKEQIFNMRERTDHASDSIAFADMLYRNRMLLPQYVLPYCEYHNIMDMPKTNNSHIDFELPDSFKEQILTLDELWQHHIKHQTKIINKCQKHMQDLNFDEIIIPEQDMNLYLRTKSENAMMIRKIRDQIRTVNNTVDDPRSEEMGSVDMQVAIQAIAANKKFDFFEQEFARRREESWVILVDNSASVKLKFNKIKDLLVSLSESADELTGREGAWSLYSFDNNFSVLKDFDEKYSDEVKGRIGGLKSGGLSFLPDALELTGRLLTENTRERKYIFVFTDAYTSGYKNTNKNLQNTIKKLEKLGIKVVGIGLSENVMKFFKNCGTGDDLREMISSFISAYRNTVSEYL